MDGAAVDGEQHLAELNGEIANFGFNEYHHYETRQINCAMNWKAVIDNFSELYHVDFIHPQHKRMVDCCNDTVHLFPNGHTGLSVPGSTINPRFPVPHEPTDILANQLTALGLEPGDFNGRVLDVREAVQQRKREVGQDLGFDYSRFSDDQLTDAWQYNLFPNIVLSFSPEHCWLMRPRPHPTDPQQCYFDKLSMVLFSDPATSKHGKAVSGPGRAARLGEIQRGENHQRPERDEFDHEQILDGSKTMTDTIDQDIELLGGVQAGMASNGFDRVWLNDDEMRVQHFHNELDHLLSDPAD